MVNTFEAYCNSPDFEDYDHDKLSDALDCERQGGCSKDKNQMMLFNHKENCLMVLLIQLSKC